MIKTVNTKPSLPSKKLYFWSRLNYIVLFFLNIYTLFTEDLQTFFALFVINGVFILNFLLLDKDKFFKFISFLGISFFSLCYFLIPSFLNISDNPILFIGIYTISFINLLTLLTI
jgi:hypothetical protein